MAHLNFKRGLHFRSLKALGMLMVLSIFLSCKTEKKEIVKTIILTNTSNVQLTSKPISIQRNAIDPPNDSNLNPILIKGQDTIPAQVNDLDGDGQWDELFFVADFLPKERKNIQLGWVNTMPHFPIKTSVRFGIRASKKEPVKPAMEEILMANQVHKKLGFQKYQTDGPTWENDKVGFRHYLDGRNAKDVFGKKAPGITPEDVGIDSSGAVVDNYHVMHDWGRDIFPVGNSVGLGGFAMLAGDKIERLGIIGSDTLNNIEKTTFKIVSEGPVNSVLSYDYHNWKTSSGNVYQASEVTSIWPGIYGYKNTVKLNGLHGDELLLVGLSNINNQKPLKVAEVENWVCLIQHDSLTYDRQWVMGSAIIVPKDKYEGYIEAPKEGQLTNSYLAKLRVKNNEPTSYYALAGWELSADENFRYSEYFYDYVINTASQLSTKIEIEIEIKQDH